MNCYVYNPFANGELPTELNKSNTLFYPERNMTADMMFKSSRPKDYHIVTDCPFLVPLYSKHEVFYLKDGEWVKPDFQTLGTSYDLIISDIFGYDSSIPQAIIKHSDVTNCMGRTIKND